MLDKRTTVVFAVLAVSLALVHGEVTKEGDKITIRTKRQQCVCIVVSPGSNQLQCNCDNTQPTTTPQGQQQQQQELQQELQQVQSPQPVPGADGSAQTTCGCVLIVIKIQGGLGASGIDVPGSSAQHPQYQCQCTNTPQANVPVTGNTNFLQDQTNNRNFLSSALNQADYFGNNINTFQQTQQPQQPQQSQQGLLNTFTPSPLTGYQNTLAPANMQASVVPQNYLNTALNQANYLNTATGLLPQQNQGLFNTQQLPTSQINNYQQDASASQFDAEPATTTCITISVPGSCMCGNNYVQCADNMCCHKRYRSQKSEESAMDIIVDVLKNIKDRLDRS